MPESESIVVVGAGQAAVAFAARLRALGCARPITLVGDEPVLPYQRPPLSKKYLTGEMTFDRLLLRPESWYEANAVTVRTGTRVLAVDRLDRQLKLSDGTLLPYATLALATGSAPRPWPASEGGDLAGVYPMRSKADADALMGEFRPGRRLVAIGGGYVGLEAAAVARMAGLEVTVLHRSANILSRVAAPETAALVRALHVSRGVAVLEKTYPVRLHGHDGKLTGVQLSDGRLIPADLVVLGIGVFPGDELARDAGLAVDNGIAVNAFAQTSDPDIYAFGDCASFPLGDRRLRLESVQNAIDQAEAAAAHVMGQGAPYAPVPWFWSDQFDAKLQSAGLFQGYDEVLQQAGPREGSHAVWYFRAGVMIAVDALNFPVAYAGAKKLLEMGRKVTRQDIETVPIKDLMKA
ncbi:NAD(P)/FAD-dependent oxidoreductase [Oryzibacter oryziterrae]|uniref:NAD(P)/FAD-dependent oxidoreductase n=1 Tax=Oryzibacter oryziterrae TaxID=2766474 RepID=UPI001F272CBA|nr:FAD-dependent oxidoreductase [Oryzibacter oryziterrae]